MSLKSLKVGIQIEEISEQIHILVKNTLSIENLFFIHLFLPNHKKIKISKCFNLTAIFFLHIISW